MKPSSLLAFAVAVAGFATVRPLGAATDGVDGIQRCESADGNAIYTDRACSAMGARTTSLPGDLALRLVMDDAVPARNATLAMGAYRDAAELLHVAMPGRRAQAAGCARTPSQLSSDLVGSFALRDVNRVAESYHWAGMSQRQALPVMKQLERLSAKPLADARFLAAWIGSGDVAASAIPADAGMMQLVFADGGGRTVDFAVRRYAGCYFIAS